MHRLASAIATVLLCMATTALAEDAATTRPTTQPSLLRDPEDGAFDISGFLSTRTGFLPIAIPITEPAVGYGLGAALAFFHDKPRAVETPRGPRFVPPNVSMVFGMGTENGSWAAGAGHLHQWNDGQVRYLVGAGYGSLNLDWYGQSDALDGQALAYNIRAAALIQKLTFQLGASDFFLGPMQRLLATNTDFDVPNLPPELTQIGPDEFHSTVSGLGLTLGYDTRDSMFSPTRGTKASTTVMWNDETIGSDFDYGRLDVEVCHYLPLGGPFTLGIRAAGGWAGEQAPFYDLPAVMLRGIKMGRYVDNLAMTAEAELRYDISRRWTLVTFGGVGTAVDDLSDLDEAEARYAGGAGVRYLVARAYDMRLGIDVARGPEDWSFYVTVGTGWLRD